ncbi:MAG: PASTA domain-containing protein [Mucilaginibacter sp.]
MNKFGAYLKTTAFRNTILLAIGAVIAVVLIAFFSLSFYTNHGEGIPVPQLKGLPANKAFDILKDQGFEYHVDSVYQLDKAPGSIIEQDPDAGTLVKQNRIIYLTMVSGLAPNISLPDVEQTQYISAVATLKNFGLKIDTTYRSDIARDMVLEIQFGGQVIKPGTKIPKGSTITLVLGDGAGASEVEIPDLVNQDLDAAKFVLHNSGLILGEIQYRGAITDSNNVIVVAQSPMKTDSAIKVSNGTRINLIVTQGKKSDGAN